MIKHIMSFAPHDFDLVDTSINKIKILIKIQQKMLKDYAKRFFFQDFYSLKKSFSSL